MQSSRTHLVEKAFLAPLLHILPRPHTLIKYVATLLDCFLVFPRRRTRRRRRGRPEWAKLPINSLLRLSSSTSVRSSVQPFFSAFRFVGLATPSSFLSSAFRCDNHLFVSTEKEGIWTGRQLRPAWLFVELCTQGGGKGRWDRRMDDSCSRP